MTDLLERLQSAVAGRYTVQRVGSSAAQPDGNIQYPIPPIPNIEGGSKEPALPPLGYWIFMGLAIGY
jgi:hypothetical protein